MPYLILVVVVMAVVFGPQWWAKYVLKKYSTPREDFPGTGGELAQHFIDRFELQDTSVERSDHGNHYNPLTRKVGLTEEIFNGKSLTAVTVAAHEIGHAIQHHIDYKPLQLRTRLVQSTWILEKLGSFLLVAMPFAAMLTRIPAVGFAMFIGGVLALGTSVIVHLVTLPVEFDASFNRALPLLEQGYIGRVDRRAARKILLACALTYVSASLAGLLNLWRWIAILRR
jgi:Zn-dependent membrane protease YugP